MEEYTIQFAVRWLHVISGITWIGLLYFFNFVNVPLQGALAADAKKAVNPQMMPRALFWFRWGAMFTFLAGLYLFWSVYIKPGGMMTGLRIWWISMGMLFGTIMWFNVWFIIWPAQKKILGGTAGDQAAALAARAKLASRANTYLSGPMLFGMLGAPHFPGDLPGLIAAIVVGLVVIHLAITASFKVGTSVN